MKNFAVSGKSMIAASLFLLLCQPVLAGGESEFAEGLKAYKSKNYRSAAKSFEAALASGNGAAENYLYMAHSYAASGNIQDAVKTYTQIQQIFKGLPAEQLAANCIARIDPHGQWRRRLASASSRTNGGATATASASSEAQNKTKLTDRIYLIPPTKGHPSVNPQTINLVKQVLLSLPRHVYNILDEGGTTINVGPNIIDKWPDAIYGAKPGEERMTLSQEAGRTYDRTVYLWERDIDLTTERLKPRRDAERLRRNLIYVLGHAYNDCLGPLTEKEEFKRLYDDDERQLSGAQRNSYSYFLQGGHKGTGDVFCAVFTTLYGGAKYDNSVLMAFPKSTAYIKSKLATVHHGTNKPKEIIAAHKIEKPKPSKPYQIPKKTVMTAHASSHKTESKVAKAEPFTPYIPKVTKIPYVRAVHDRHYLKGTIEGKPVYWMLETGAFETIIGKNKLIHLGIEPPSGPSTGEVGTVLGNHPCWDMELNITVGDIRKREKVKVVEKQDLFLLGQPFLQDLHYTIDRASHYITFTSKEEDSSRQVHVDSFEVPFRMIDGNMIVQAKVNGIGLEMNFDTGAPVTLITGSDNLRLGISSSEFISKFTWGNGDVYNIVLRSVDFGQIKKRKVPAHIQPNLGGKSVLGENFFGNRKFLVDNDKKVIRFLN